LRSGAGADAFATLAAMQLLNAPVALTAAAGPVATLAERAGALMGDSTVGVNANNFPVHMRFSTAAGRPVAMAELIAHDGRPFRDTSRPGVSPPTGAAGHPLMTSLIDFGAAERFDVLLRPPAPKQYRLTVNLYQWITSAVLATRVIPVTVI
jgi:hypothetical protein